MDLAPVDSSFLSHAGYNDATRTFGVTYKTTGETWHYTNVPPHVYAGFCGALSAGRYYSQYIRGHYPGTKQPARDDWSKGVPRG